MRIGMIAPPWLPVPPIGYGGTEAVIDGLTRGLTSLGHDVHLFSVGDSTCPVPLGYLYPHAVEPMGITVAEAAHTLAAYDALADMDLIHDHTSIGMLVAGEAYGASLPLVTTHHGPFDADYRRILARSARHGAIIAISHSQARAAIGVPIAAVIHHGVDCDQYRLGPGDGGYLLFLGRMSPDKGVHDAIRIARLAGQPLIIAAKMRDASEREYFETMVAPNLNSDVELLLEPAAPRRRELLRNATALLNPIKWPEPFGLVMAEALASGTPVLVPPLGAAPEIVDHGRTGFLCTTDEDMARAVALVPELDRAVCRQEAQRRFSLERMAIDHDHLYRLLRHRPGEHLARKRAIGHIPASRRKDGIGLGRPG